MSENMFADFVIIFFLLFEEFFEDNIRVSMYNNDEKLGQSYTFS